MEEWRARLDAGDADAAWTLFIERHHRLVRAIINRLTRDDDDQLDAFAHVCESLCRDEFARLRKFSEGGPRGAKFTTWLVVVVRNLTIDWQRARDGRPRLTPPPGLTPLRGRIYDLVIAGRNSHAEAYEIIGGGEAGPSFGAFLREVSETYRAVDRRRWSHLAQLHGATPTVEDPPEETEDSDLEPDRRRVDAALAILSADEREAIRLFVVEELPAAEVAKAVGWAGPKTVYNRVRRALAAVRRAARDDPPPG